MKNLIKKYPMLGSSVDEEKIALTIKSLAFLVVSVAGLFNYSIDTNDVIVVMTQAVAISSGVTMILGIIRKYLNKK